MKRKVVSYENSPVKAPVSITLVVYLMYDLGHFNQFWSGIILCIMALIWIKFIALKVTQEENDIFEDKP